MNINISVKDTASIFKEIQLASSPFRTFYALQSTQRYWGITRSHQEQGIQGDGKQNRVRFLQTVKCTNKHMKLIKFDRKRTWCPLPPGV